MSASPGIPRAGPVIRVFVTALLAVLVASIAVPVIRRAATEREMRAALASDEFAERARAIGYYLAPIDPADTLSRPRFFAVRGVEELVRGASDAALIDYYDAYGGSRAFRERFPVANLRAVRLKLDATDDPELAFHALAQVGSTTDARADGEALTILGALLDHPDEGVRLAALEHACWREGPGAIPFVERAMRDTAPKVARAAWLAVAHLEPSGGYQANYREMPVGVAEAVLVASTLMGGESARPLLERASGEPALGEAVAYCGALLESSETGSSFAIIDDYAHESVDSLRAREPGIEDRRERARLRLAITSREPTDDGVDEALLLAADGLLAPRDVLVALLHAGRARSVIRVLLGSSSGERTIEGDHRAVLEKFFSPSEFFLPVPGEIPEGARSRALAHDALRAWWMCVGNRVSFDAGARLYTLDRVEKQAKTGKAPR